MVHKNNKSPFIKELEEDISEILALRTKWHCPNCMSGRLIERKGPYGKFYGCSRYPNCDFKRKKETKTVQ